MHFEANAPLNGMEVNSEVVRGGKFGMKLEINTCFPQRRINIYQIFFPYYRCVGYLGGKVTHSKFFITVLVEHMNMARL